MAVLMISLTIYLIAVACATFRSARRVAPGSVLSAQSAPIRIIQASAASYGIITRFKNGVVSTTAPPRALVLAAIKGVQSIQLGQRRLAYLLCYRTAWVWIANLRACATGPHFVSGVLYKISHFVGKWVQVLILA